MIPEARRRPLRRLDRWCGKVYERNYTAAVEARVRVRVRSVADGMDYKLELAEAVSDNFCRKRAITLAGMLFSEVYSGLQEFVQRWEEAGRNKEDIARVVSYSEFLDQVIEGVGGRLEGVKSRKRREEEIERVIREMFKVEKDLIGFMKLHHKILEKGNARKFTEGEISDEYFEVIDTHEKIAGEMCPYIVRQVFGYLFNKEGKK